MNHSVLRHVRLLDDQHVSATAALLARSMFTDAAYAYLIEDEGRRERGLGEFFEGNLRLHVAHGCTYVGLDDAARVVGTVTFRPPRGIAISPLTMIRYGLLPFAMSHGVRAVRRMLWLKDAYDRLDADLDGTSRHWYVHMMAVSETLQGRGIGSALLEQVLARTAATSAEPTVLTTHLLENVRFYQRFGFETVWERTVAPPAKEPYAVFGMVRRPENRA